MGSKRTRTLMIMSEGFGARKGDQKEKNTYDCIRGFDELKKGH